MSSEKAEMVSSVLNVTFSFQCGCLQVARGRDREGTVTAGAGRMWAQSPMTA